MIRRFAGPAAILLSLLVVLAGDTYEMDRGAEPAAAAVPPPAASPAADEIFSSPNLRQMANLPKGARVSGINTDLAFRGDYAFAGNYDGFSVYDISDPNAPEVAVQVLCPGPQNDVAVHGDLLFVGADSPSSDSDSCAGLEGVKIFDVSDPRRPRYVAVVPTECGAHTVTLVPGKGADRSVYVYASSPCMDPDDRITIVKVPLNDPAAARVVPAAGRLTTGDDAITAGCHDVTAYPEKGLAAAACVGDGVLLDISEPAAPRVIARVRDDNFAFWHSATFNNAATKVVFTDELGGGVGRTCTPDTDSHRGANAIFDITGQGTRRKLEFRGYFKIARHSAGNCVAHNGSLIPVPGRDVMVQAWYQGGVSVWDFTDSRRPEEIAYWARADQSFIGGSWSAYWYNGVIYSSDLQQGLDVLRLDDPRTDPAKTLRTDHSNPQTQDDHNRWCCR
jgi:hypothetical protein